MAKRRKLITVRKSAEENSVTFHNLDGVTSTFNVSKFDKYKRNAMREIAVDHWCRMNNQPPMFATK